jgi:hypothetical protein
MIVQTFALLRSDWLWYLQAHISDLDNNGVDASKRTTVVKRRDGP